MAYIFKRHIGSGSSSTISIDIQLLIAELHKYGPINSVIQQLSQEKDNLRNQIASLKAQKQDLERQKQSIIESGLFLFLVFLVSVFHYIPASKGSIY